MANLLSIFSKQKGKGILNLTAVNSASPPSMRPLCWFWGSLESGKSIVTMDIPRTVCNLHEQQHKRRVGEED